MIRLSRGTGQNRHPAWWGSDDSLGASSGNTVKFTWPPLSRVPNLPRPLLFHEPGDGVNCEFWKVFVEKVENIAVFANSGGQLVFFHGIDD